MGTPKEHHGATRRFSSRVENYIKYRPGYPDALLAFMRADIGLRPGQKVVELGSGTGILSKQLLDAGYQVDGVEPNAAMRQAAEAQLQAERVAGQFVSVDARAEATGLADGVADAVVAGQAFHWFDRVATREECQRIVQPGGPVVLIWNDRRTEGTPFLVGYERLLHEHGTDYAAVNHKQIDADVIAAFFAPQEARCVRFDNVQVFDYEGLKGRLLSSSYTPTPDDPRHGPMLEALERLFAATQRGGTVDFVYDTVVYYGSL